MSTFIPVRNGARRQFIILTVLTFIIATMMVYSALREVMQPPPLVYTSLTLAEDSVCPGDTLHLRIELLARLDRLPPRRMGRGRRDRRLAHGCASRGLGIRLPGT